MHCLFALVPTQCAQMDLSGIGFSHYIHFIPLEPPDYYQICISKILQNMYTILHIYSNSNYYRDMNSVALNRAQHELLFDKQNFGKTTFR